jgi:hypothetical protein
LIGKGNSNFRRKNFSLDRASSLRANFCREALSDEVT